VTTFRKSGPEDIVSQRSEKELPNGYWIRFPHLPPDVTDEEFQQFLSRIGLEIPVERISVRHYNDGTCVLVSFEQNLMVTLVNWVINGDKLRDHEVLAKDRK
jgi:hypothetical protein